MIRNVQVLRTAGGGLDDPVNMNWLEQVRIPVLSIISSAYMSVAKLEGGIQVYVLQVRPAIYYWVFLSLTGLSGDGGLVTKYVST
jgi:hypothetical protein